MSHFGLKTKRTDDGTVSFRKLEVGLPQLERPRRRRRHQVGIKWVLTQVCGPMTVVFDQQLVVLACSQFVGDWDREGPKASPLQSLREYYKGSYYRYYIQHEQQGCGHGHILLFYNGTFNSSGRETSYWTDMNDYMKWFWYTMMSAGRWHICRWTC